MLLSFASELAGRPCVPCSLGQFRTIGGIITEGMANTFSFLIVAMMCVMLRCRHGYEIVRCVVCSIPVDVMNVFTCSLITTTMLFPDFSMLSNIAMFIGEMMRRIMDHPVAFSVLVSATLPSRRTWPGLTLGVMSTDISKWEACVLSALQACLSGQWSLCTASAFANTRRNIESFWRQDNAFLSVSTFEGLSSLVMARKKSYRSPRMVWLWRDWLSASAFAMFHRTQVITAAA